MALEPRADGISKKSGLMAYRMCHHIVQVTFMLQMMNDLFQYITGIPRLSHILYGNDALSETYNKYIFIIVHKFIKDTERFKN